MYCRDVYPEMLKETAENFGQDTWYPGLDSNLALPEYKSEHYRLVSLLTEPLYKIAVGGIASMARQMKNSS
jgi:hypothetical protein